MRLPFTGLLLFLSFISVIYFVIRLMPWVRNYLLWRLRNRLIVAYILIAVVPVVLLLSMAGLAAYGLYLQLGAHLLHDDLQDRISMVAGDGEAIASAIEDEANRGIAPHDEAILARPEVAVLIAAAHREWPDIRVLLNRGQNLLRAGNGRGNSGIVEFEHQIWIPSAQTRHTPAGPIFILVGAPVTSELLDSLSSELGPIQMMLLQPSAEKPRTGISLEIQNRLYIPGQQVLSHRRTLGPPAHWFDVRVNGASTIAALHHDPGSDPAPAPVLASFALRPSALNRRLLTSVGAVGPLLVN